MLRRSFISLPRYYSEKQWLDKLRTRYDASKGWNDLAAWQMAITDLGFVYKDMSKRDNVTFIKGMDCFLCAKHVFCDFSQKVRGNVKYFVFLR